MWIAEIKKVGVEGNNWSEDIVRYNPERYHWQNIPKNSSETKAREYAEELISFFNRTIREGSGDIPREVVRVYKE